MSRWETFFRFVVADSHVVKTLENVYGPNEKLAGHFAGLVSLKGLSSEMYLAEIRLIR